MTLNYPEQEEPSLFDRASEVWSAGEKPLPARIALAEAFRLRQNLIASYARLRERHPEQVARARELAARYEAGLRRLGLRDDHVAARYRPPRSAPSSPGRSRCCSSGCPSRRSASC